MHRTLTFALLALVVAWSADGLAKEKKAVEDSGEKAETLYKEGTAAFEAGKFEEALAAFTEAYNLSGEPGLVFNLAVCSEQTGNVEKAIAYYQLYLEENPDASDAGEVKKRLEILKTPVQEGPKEEPELETVEPGPPDQVDLEAIDQGEKEKGPFGPGIVIGTGGLVLAAGLLTAISAYKKYGDLEDSCSPDCTDSQLKTTRNTALVADILMVAGGVAVAAGAIWWITVARGEREESRVAWRAVPAASDEGAGLFVEGSF